MTVAFEEFARSPRIDFGPNGKRAFRHVLVDWPDVDDMTKELLGDGFDLGGQRRAKYPGDDKLIVATVRVENHNAVPDAATHTNIQTDINEYSTGKAEIKVNYQWLTTKPNTPEPVTIEPNTFLTYRTDRGGEYITQPDHAFFWEGSVDTPVPEKAFPTLRITLREHHLTWHRVTRPPWTAMSKASGSVNQGAFMGFPAQTLLFDGEVAEAEYVIVPDTGEIQEAMSLSYVFLERSLKLNDEGDIGGWNHQFRAEPTDDPAWDRLKHDTGGAGPIGSYAYHLTDQFPALFQYEPTSP